MQTKTRFQIQTSFATAFTVLTGGVFLSGLATMMGAGDVLISYISVIMNICGAAILFFAPFMERFRSRKRVTIALTLLSKLATLSVVFIPLLVPKEAQLFFFVPMIVLAFSLQAQAKVSLNHWLIHFVEDEKRGRAISLRMTAELVITVLLSLAAGRFTDALEARYIAFAALFGAAFALTVFEIATMLRIDDVRATQAPATRYRFRDLFLTPTRNKEFLGFVLYMSLFYMILYIADSFTITYLLNHMELGYARITLIQQVFMSLPQVVFLYVWGKISDKRGHAFVLYRCLWFFVLEELFIMLASPRTILVFLPLAFFFSSIGNSGFNVSMFNRRYELIPEEGRILHDNFFHAAVGVALLLGPLVGSAIKGLVTTAGIAEGIEFGEFRALYAVAFVGLIVLQWVMGRKGKKGRDDTVSS